MVMVNTIENIRKDNVGINEVGNILESRFNIYKCNDCELYIKPEKKENKDMLISKIKQELTDNLNITERLELYIKFIKTHTDIIVRLKRTERNSR